MENNELIAEFLGYKQNVNHPLFKNSTYWYKDGVPPLAILIFKQDWNWLMRVIEKILEICSESDMMDMYYDVVERIPNIKETYNAIIDFITLYNLQNHGKH